MKLFITGTQLATVSSPMTKYFIEQRFADGKPAVKFNANHWRHTDKESPAEYLRSFKALFSKENVENWQDFSETFRDKMKADRYYVQQ